MKLHSKGETEMDDLDRYIAEQMLNPKFKEEYEKSRPEFEIMKEKLVI